MATDSGRIFAGSAAGQLDQQLIEGTSQRWIVLTDGPGMGKSALLAARLARREVGRRINATTSRARLWRSPGATLAVMALERPTTTGIEFAHDDGAER